ncbi:MAG TPA: response regulator [Candidatus Obscuribacterales bacterium]
MSKILVIEDEEPVRANIVKLLTLEDFEAIGAENGAVGVQVAKEQMPDLIICDVMMPELDGYGVLNALQQDDVTATIPFIFLTAKAAKEDLRHGMELGASDYLNKPFTRNELLKVINTQLEKQAKFKKQSDQKLVELRDSITLSLPHQLRTPLNGILGFSEIMIDSADSMETAEIVEMAETIYKSAKDLDRLVQNFLLYAELEVIATEPEKLKTLRNSYSDFSAEVITEVAKQKTKEVGREADISLKLIDAPVQISETDLKKIVEELLDNAFKYSKSGTLVSVISSINQNTLVIEIINKGRGMTSEQIENIGAYMQFARKVYAQEGSGLGLFIAKRLAELHGGELYIESVPNEETTVRVALPM